MRQGRIKAPGDPVYAFYHCVNRIVDRRFVLRRKEKEKFVQFLDEYAFFCGVTAVTFNVMDNHFHLLVMVPKAPASPLTDEELLVRVESLSGTAGSKTARQQLTWFRERGQHEAAEALRQRFLVRMYDISQFMKSVQQRFSQWFNRRHGRTGRLWESRFKSVLVESQGQALAAMAAYIDLNGVRAGMVSDPMHSLWCGYGRAVAGNASAQEGLRIVMAGAQGKALESLSGAEAMRQYRMWLFVQGEQNEGTDAQGRPLRKGFSKQEVMATIRSKGCVPVGDYVRLRVRYFTDGVVMGSKNYVDGVFEALRTRFGPRRQNGARRMLGVDSSQLYVLRDLKRDIIGWKTRPASQRIASSRFARSGPRIC